MKAEIVLEDCRRALHFAEDAQNEQDFRICWVALVSLLRAVGHVLDKTDAASDPALREAVAERWAEWRRDRDEHQIFWEFIEAERNSVLKTYQIGVQSGTVEVLVQQAGRAAVSVLDECIFKPLVGGPYEGEDGRDVAREAIAWWENQLTEVRGGDKRG